MLRFTTLEGQVIPYGKTEAHNLDDEKAFSLSLAKMTRALDINNRMHVSAFQKNLNVINKILQLEGLPEDGVWDEDTSAAMDYFTRYTNLFRDHGVTEHLKARELDAMISPAEKVFTEAEYPPTMEEMKSLEIDIDKLYEESA